ncbi:hypothetical protein [Methylobacterium sp. Leaf112]|uniref:hypothetical protein n=1 Tax=Methylobacterium sp. Leaf112 TaxID=1736258 RepID=UPI0006FF5F0C|nr:hypothetical protein [Methylobacterium sp. Leaf112]KQP62148.1 hypothetical protein ASF52_05680 [Methylobacterium sp. Leaf112]
MKTSIQVDTATFRGKARAYVDQKVAPAFVDAINVAANAAKAAVVEAMPKYLDRPNPFTLQGVQVLPAVVGATGPKAGALVRIQRDQAEYLQYQVYGGDRGPGDVATTSEGPIVPGADATLDAYGNMPDGYISQAMMDPDVAWVTLKEGEPPALIRDRGGHMEILALIVHEIHYEARFPFLDIVTQAAAAALLGAFGAAVTYRGRL